MNIEKRLTIFTPTYNRGYILKQLYSSLINQNNKEFIWLIVDDGSEDCTSELVNEWIGENQIEIQYIKQENQGKHIAHNSGVKNCKTEFFFCVDSDDYLLKNAVQDILDEIQYLNRSDVAGIVAPRIYKDGTTIGKEMVKGIKYSTLSKLEDKYGVKGDTALIFKTNILKKYKFPKINGENFLGEGYIYSQIDQNYKLYISNKKYYVCEYLDDGYTKNVISLIIKNPKGYTLLKKERIKVSYGLRAKLKEASLYYAGGLLSKEKRIIKNSPKKIVTFFSIPLALLIYNIRFKRLNKF
ncbi:glycosyltransferase family 2 protein [Clostridium sp. B9]|uniref:glycosyltransferase family 2 protein n=1 Tax=Clostridium sp. B9 TaxID=3423224 RepID=UPI003D2EC8E5